ncbi:unnamed protein product [Rhizoctonia solani]|uniref:Uncharacterized protein n=1 Tax=Rhizoctonia solani TaxID=456999 RepID=A0A8H3A8I5_9AGAM|nr:unnamed protein product [Rhizoctonia solani]
MSWLALINTLLVSSSLVGAAPTAPVDSDSTSNFTALTAPPRAKPENYTLNQGSYRVMNQQWDSEAIGGGEYTLYNNLFGSKDTGTSGSQETQALSYDAQNAMISWTTKYQWRGNPGNVKSYANVALNEGTRRKLTEIETIPTRWDWTYTHPGGSDKKTDPLVADVSYDLWLSRDPKSGTASSSSTVEVMVWLSNRRAGPAGFRIATAKVGEINWELFKGRVGTWEVYSFVAPSEMTNYSGDLKQFFTYLNANEKVSSDQYLVAVQAGTEPFEGTGTLLTNGYTAAINPV